MLPKFILTTLKVAFKIELSSGKKKCDIFETAGNIAKSSKFECPSVTIGCSTRDELWFQITVKPVYKVPPFDVFLPTAFKMFGPDKVP